MPESRVTISQIEKLPKSSWDLPRTTVFIRLGCIACPNQTCFRVNGINSMNPELSINPEATTAVASVVEEIDKTMEVKGGSSGGWEKTCEEPCPQLEDMEVAIGLLNEQFGSTITVRD